MMTTTEAAAFFQVSPQTVLRWADQGCLSSIRTPGGNRRFDSEEVGALFGQADPQDEPMTAGEVAELFRVEVHTVARWVREGSLRAEVAPSGRYRYTRAAAMELLRRDED